LTKAHPLSPLELAQRALEGAFQARCITVRPRFQECLAPVSHAAAFSCRNLGGRSRRHVTASSQAAVGPWFVPASICVSRHLPCSRLLWSAALEVQAIEHRVDLHPLTTVELGFVPQFVPGGSGTTMGGRPSAFDAKSAREVFGRSKDVVTAPRSAVPTGHQLASFRNLPPADTVGRPVRGRPSQGERTSAPRHPQKGRGPHLFRAPVPQHVQAHTAGRRFGRQRRRPPQPLRRLVFGRSGWMAFSWLCVSPVDAPTRASLERVGG
jgi:hypothetical protein